MLKVFIAGLSVLLITACSTSIENTNTDTQAKSVIEGSVSIIKINNEPEVWVHKTKNPDFLGVGAYETNDDEFSWAVEINVAEFVRSELLESMFQKGITDALKQVENVTSVVHEDRERWIVSGEKIKGKALVESCVKFLQEIEPELKKELLP